MSSAARIALALSMTTALIVPAFAHAGNGHEFLGPVPYVEETDSEFALRFGFCLENFEDGQFDEALGASGNGTITAPGGNIDSVDADDGELDGFGIEGRSYFNGSGSITITFDPNRLNGLPTAAGMVWTDGGAGTTTFEAFGPGGVSLGTSGPHSHADGSNAGTTAEDRFYGVINDDGISAIKLTNTAGGIEVDHIQLNLCYLCGDADIDRGIKATDALIALKTAVNTDDCLECLCDTDASGDITATDALRILRVAVGQAVATECIACGVLM